MPPTFRCDLARAGKPFRHSWSHIVGSGHAALALRADWQAQLKRCHDELGIGYVRFHGILCDDMGTFSIQQGQKTYSFFNAFQIYDYLLSIGVRPVVELSFMPDALASGNVTVFHYNGNVTPPSDPEEWSALIRTFVSALVARYGATEVRRWYFEVWNEPNLRAFWTGTQAEYFDLYHFTVKAIKEVDADLRVGGPATADDEWIDEFVAFTDRHGLPLDFVSTHHYPTDAFGEPGDDTEKQLAAGTRGILMERARDSVRRAKGKPLLYTEWSTSSNPFFHRHDEPYAAAFVAKSCLDVADFVEAYSYWTFSDIFEENYFSSVPFHGGFGLLTIHGIAKPVYRALELLHRLGEERLIVDGAHATVDCTVTRRTASEVTILLTNHALPEHAIHEERVRLRLANSPQVRIARIERIDTDHANPRRAWESMGEPTYPTAEQLGVLHEASLLVREAVLVDWDDGDLVIELELPVHAVAAVTLTLTLTA